MFANWKSAVYEYAHRRNKLEMDGGPEPLYPIVGDDHFVGRLEQRLRRLKASRTARGATPVRSETGLRIRTVDEGERKAVIELELRRSIDYEQYGHALREDRIEVEIVTVDKRGDRWYITEVEPAVTERRPYGGAKPPFVAIDGEMPEHPVRAAPFLNTALLQPGIASAGRRVLPYNREKARQYAETWWNGANPNYLHFEVDCTNFVSQCLFAGGAPMNYTGRRESGWWYRGRVDGRELWSFSWAVAHSLHAYLSASRTALRAETVDSPDKLAIGDVICYDWDGEGRFQHNTIVTGFDADRMPLVNAHTTDSRLRYWDYRDSYAWTPNTRYRFYHIADYF